MQREPRETAQCTGFAAGGFIPNRCADRCSVKIQADLVSLHEYRSL